VHILICTAVGSKTAQPARQVLCLFLACSRKMVAKALDFVKKGFDKKDEISLCFNL
jgi:hypothetical protein